MRQHKFCPDKQQYNDSKPFPVYVLKIEEEENYYKCFKSGMVHEPGICTRCFYIRITEYTICLKTGMHMNFYFMAAR